jgi:glyoxylase-like metal-dependent hydrolase (beta-lactamase superfamily II)
MTSIKGVLRESKDCFVVSPGVWGMKIVFVNVFFVADMIPGSEGWVLVDAGLQGSAEKIINAAEDLFGMGTKPSAIVLTHGHFDHRGALNELLEQWQVPVYAHRLEHPYLNGTASYPPPDPTVGGGMMAWMSFAYPKKPIDISAHLRELPVTMHVPGLPGWKWYHTPGHAPGHVSLFREDDRTLIAGDAFVTTDQESIFSVMTQKEELHGPPKYFTTDWIAAKDSVEMLATLEPEIVATGHGKPMYGIGMRLKLDELIDNFEKSAVPAAGRYVQHPATADGSGPLHVPPAVPWRAARRLGIALLALITGLGIFGASKRMMS